METQEPARRIRYELHALAGLRDEQNPFDRQAGHESGPLSPLSSKDLAAPADSAMDVADGLLVALDRLFTAANRLSMLVRLCPREQVALPACYLDALRSEIIALECRTRAVDMDSEMIAALASNQVADLASMVTLLTGRRYQVPNWAAKVGIVWLRLRVLAVILSPVVPDIAMRLSSVLTGRGPSWPQFDGIQGVQLPLIPCGPMEGDTTIRLSP